MNYILFDDNTRIDFLPLTFTRPLADIRFGILTIREKWEKCLKVSTSTLTERYLSSKYPLKTGDTNILINGSICPDQSLIKEINKLKQGEALCSKDVFIALNLSREMLKDVDYSTLLSAFNSKLPYTKEFLKLNNLWDIFTKNGEAINKDYALLTKNRKSKQLSKTNRIIGKDIFIEEGAIVEYSVFNTLTGPIYIGKNTEIWEGSMIRGPFALCQGSSIKMGSKIYGPTTVGPYSRVGGELNNVIITGYSNKAHEGFLGNSIIGEWCNLGADSNSSNLKNNYANVKIWNYRAEKFIDTQLQFCGLIMGDHSKCGINTMFNTGTVVGVSANIYGSGFPRTFIPSFSWGGAQGFITYQLNKVFETAEKVMERRKRTLENTDKAILKDIFNSTEKYRVWETVAAKKV